MTPVREWLPVEAADGHRWDVLHIAPPGCRRVLVWLPALGVSARHYEIFAQALAERGTAVLVHEWRGFGSSSQRASRSTDWGYRELLELDIPATGAAAAALHPDVEVTVGGHSLGGQLALCSLALEPGFADRAWLVASGAPWYRAFRRPTRWWLPIAYRILDALAQAAGALPGRRIGFGGQEARGVIRDWSRSALSGRYAARGIGDLEGRLAAVEVPVDAVVLAHDWLAPRPSLDFLLSKVRSGDVTVEMLDDDALGARADHFAWMKAPGPVADALLRAARPAER
jgi:predicted alpha/beta hydrolase